MVGRHLRLQPVDRAAVRGGHDAGVVHEQVDRSECGRGGRGLAHGREVGQVHDEGVERGAGHLGGDRLGSGGELVRRTSGQHDAGTVPGQLEGGVEAEPAEGRTRDDRGATGQVADVVGRPDVLAHGVMPIAATTRSPSSASPATPTSPACAGRRPPASTMKDSRSMVRVTAGIAVRRGRDPAAPVLADDRGHRLVPGDLEAYDAARRCLRALADDEGQALHQVVGGVERGRRVEVARHVEGPAHVLLVHPHVEGPVAQEQAGGPADRAEQSRRGRVRVRGRVGEQLRVAGGRGLADLGDEPVG